jgi:hypothetical protein
LNRRQHRTSLHKMAALDLETLCAGHGEPLLSGAGDQIRAALAKYPDS